ncbi:unnamed protein product [Symbiodinium natans]|uniref:Uncharacterized protein n=1 Tax=Symbiodinium natans TaxID=878477 RepID=A0A812MIV1_9DINO|nr:unnamed protein product [Symbiodinium natans]
MLNVFRKSLTRFRHLREQLQFTLVQDIRHAQHMQPHDARHVVADVTNMMRDAHEQPGDLNGRIHQIRKMMRGGFDYVARELYHQRQEVQILTDRQAVQNRKLDRMDRKLDQILTLLQEQQTDD